MIDRTTDGRAFKMLNIIDEIYPGVLGHTGRPR